MISIVITNYNYSRFLPRAIRSAIDQTVEAEVIVVDDCSTDQSKIMLDSFGSKVRPIKLEENKGLSHARNVGWRAASGDKIVFLDADDMLHRDFCRIAELYLDFHRNVRALATDYYFVDEWDNHLQEQAWADKPLACGVVYYLADLYYLGGYHEELRQNEDVEFRARFLASNRALSVLNIPLYRYRFHGENMTLREVG